MCVADPLCPAAGTFCASSFTLATCSVDSGCFYQPALPATCAINTVCERVAPASCADPSWAEWPVPPAASPSAYSDNKDGTITDNITGLMWQSPPAATAMTQSAAIIYCSTMLTLAGHSDWRLPTRIELLSLVDLGRTATPAINPIFTNTLSEIYWTSTTYALAASYSWAVNFTFGHGVPHHDDITNTGAVRCVR
jgi:hypothetical protein